MADQVLMREGDTRPVLEVTLEDEVGAPMLLPLTAGAVQLVVTDWTGTELWRAPAVPDPDQLANAGQVSYAWRPADTATAGVYGLSFAVTWPDGTTSTVPTAEPIPFTVAAAGEGDVLVVDLGKLARRIGLPAAELTDEVRQVLEEMTLDVQADVEGYLRRPIVVTRFVERARPDPTEPSGWRLRWDPVVRVVSSQDNGDGTATVTYVAGFDVGGDRRCAPIARYVLTAAAEEYLSHPVYGAKFRLVASKSAGGQSISYERPASMARRANVALPTVAQPGAPPSIETLARFRRRGVYSARRQVGMGATTASAWPGTYPADGMASIEGWQPGGGEDYQPVDEMFTRDPRTGEVTYP